MKIILALLFVLCLYSCTRDAVDDPVYVAIGFGRQRPAGGPGSDIFPGLSGFSEDKASLS